MASTSSTTIPPPLSPLRTPSTSTSTAPPPPLTASAPTSKNDRVADWGDSWELRGIGILDRSALGNLYLLLWGCTVGLVKGIAYALEQAGKPLPPPQRVVRPPGTVLTREEEIEEKVQWMLGTGATGGG